VLATGSITYLLLSTAESEVLAAGTVNGSAQAHGTIVNELTLTCGNERRPPDHHVGTFAEGEERRSHNHCVRSFADGEES
jgi:hypothetical protein